ncbi:MAG: hypothetical protein V4549_12615 [Bacteroidota bacterium]
MENKPPTQITVHQEISKTNWIPFTYGVGSHNRIFNCNELYFENISEGLIYMNDVYRVAYPVHLISKQNEIDTTPYKFTVISGFIQGWYKQNAGVDSYIESQYNRLNAPIPNRRDTIKHFYDNKRPKLDF